jgi:hypothetical protein
MKFGNGRLVFSVKHLQAFSIFYSCPRNPEIWVQSEQTKQVALLLAQSRSKKEASPKFSLKVSELLCLWELVLQQKISDFIDGSANILTEITFKYLHRNKIFVLLHCQNKKSI